MSKTAQIIWAIVAFVVIWFWLIPMMPSIYHAQLIAQIVTIVGAIWFAMRIGGITPP